MSYTSIVSMTNSPGLIQRIAACAASERGFTQDARSWAAQNIMRVCAHNAAEWTATWDYAVATMTVNDNPDIGARNDVIGDHMILSVVQALLPPTPTE